MKPVDQSRFGASEGNCLAACIASILEVPLTEVDFVGTRGDWLDKAQKVLSKFDLFYLAIALPPDANTPVPIMAELDTFCVLVGHTKRNRGTDVLHCVVGKVVASKPGMISYEMWHDPNTPDRDGLDGLPTEIGLLVPRNPHHFAGRNG